ncbi:hypothetical protein [Pseudomonas sp. BIC9C]|nr:hypothetical protein [Pseudomonas sp. BIC9C]
MRKATCALFILVCAGSSASLCQLFKNEAYRPGTADSVEKVGLPKLPDH